MIDTVKEVLAECTEEALEQMFFVRPLSEPAAPHSAESPHVVAELNFQGEPSGSFSLSVSPAAARSIAADFLAEEENILSKEQVEEVICELANIICGSVLTRLESRITFRLASPQIVKAAQPWETGQALIQQFHLWNGNFTVGFRTERPVCAVHEYVS
ncbi:MAG: chemotaxis protein CheX [Acidobacteriia bacterium]|nr:chemotaxis protein CheX [Terriglobia bacterium]